MADRKWSRRVMILRIECQWLAGVPSQRQFFGYRAYAHRSRSPPQPRAGASRSSDISCPGDSCRTHPAAPHRRRAQISLCCPNEIPSLPARKFQRIAHQLYDADRNGHIRKTRVIAIEKPVRSLTRLLYITQFPVIAGGQPSPHILYPLDFKLDFLGMPIDSPFRNPCGTLDSRIVFAIPRETANERYGRV